MNLFTHNSCARIGCTFSLIFLSLALTPSTHATQVKQSVSTPIASASNKSIGWGSHGMAVFGGREGLYASHLPMFHPPHDTQVIIRFHLQDKTIDEKLRDALALKPELWTLDPEEFDLLRLAPEHPQRLKKFTARFVQGHFERGGKEQFLNQTAVIDEVILFRRLSVAERLVAESRYHVIGNKSERFLVKEIDRRPDFDLIASLKLSKTWAEDFPKTILLANKNISQPSAKEWRDALLKQAGNGVSLNRVLYFETGDLK
jgi:hypothetical protein